MFLLKLSFLALILLVSFSISHSYSYDQCSDMCAELRSDILDSNIICREARRTLPRPKVGNFCTTAMEQGYSDACIALCKEQKPVSRIAQSCRAASLEMPRPTVKKWCEHGYKQAFTQTSNYLSNYFTSLKDKIKEETEKKIREEKEMIEKESLKYSPPTLPKDSRPVLFTISVNIYDNDQTVEVHEGEEPEEAVHVFCGNHMPLDIGGCIRQILPLVLEKIE